ncbi:Hsp70 family protein [Actinoplanes flavus]|uniref:Hsp70 family protein n=1 Tax=Actinoplanes flavus TaxID=2820290 RepID=A0ABS3UJ17_9ACTN|nr:Hsp70 family protein [Actinoplanes flavus]MBO3738741.1 Hsp70 family protein [Actinoplanes flavus]
MPGWSLSIDFGTSNTAAAYRRGDGPPTAVRLSDSAEQMPSAVLATPQGIQVGTTAVRSARLHPDGFERSPKRLIGQDAVLLGGRDIPVVTLVAAVLRVVATRAARVAGDDRPDTVLLTHPQDWAEPRRQVLRAAAVEAGFPDEILRLVPEPVAAVAHYAHTTPLPAGSTVAVFDFGGGTCDVALLRADGDTSAMRVLASAGADPLGGDVFDHLLLTAVLARLADRDRGDLARAVRDPANARALQALRNDVREAKHELSEHEYAGIPVVAADAEEIVTITADEFDEMVAPQVRRATELTAQTLAQAGLTAGELHALYLTGGSSHLRAVQRDLTALLGRPPATLEDPKLVVALGAHHAVTATAETARAVPAPAPAPAVPAPAPAGPAPAVPAPAVVTSPPPAADVPGLSAAAQRVLQVNPELAAALAGTPQGPAVIDDLVTLAALMCVPGLIERVIADPGLIARMRQDNAGVEIPPPPASGVPLPVKVFFGDSPPWLAAHWKPAARQRWNDQHGPGDIWAVCVMRTWCTATEAERQEILRRPDWSTWAPGNHYLDAFTHGDPPEPDQIWLSTATEPPTAVAPFRTPISRPAHPTPQQQAYLSDLADLYAPPAGGGLAAATARPPDVTRIVRTCLGLPPRHTRQVSVMGVGMTGWPSELLFYPAAGARPPAVVIPLSGPMLDLTSGRAGWNGVPVILTPDVVTGVRIKVDWGNAQRRIVVGTTYRPGADCPPPGVDVHLRTDQITEVANQIRTHLGRP